MEIPDAKPGTMFGALCIKTLNGKSAEANEYGYKNGECFTAPLRSANKGNAK